MNALFVIFCLSFAEKPDALRAMEEARRALPPADIVWTFVRRSGPVNRVERRRNRYGQDSILVGLLGNDDGVVTQDRDGFPQLASEKRYVRNNEYCAEYTEGRPECYVTPSSGARAEAKERAVYFKDIRSLGLNVSFLDDSRIDGAVESFPDAGLSRRYSVEQRGVLHIVTAELESNESLVWEINSEKGWNAERIRLVRGGQIVYEAEIALERFGNVWFPSSYELFHGPQREPVYAVRVEEARFDPRAGEAPLGLKDLRLEVGTQVRFFLGPGEPERKVWDGENAIDVEAFRQKRREGRITLGPTMQGYADGRPNPHPEEKLHWSRQLSAQRPRAALSEWERYVQEFINRFALDDDQSQRAIGILQECQARGNAYLDSQRNQFERIEQRLAAFEDLSELRKTGELDELDGRMKDLMKPIDEIFEQQLKPKLDRIPTRAQRQAAEQAQASVPGTASAPATNERP